MSTVPRPYRHPSLGFLIELPPAAEVLDDVPGVALAAAEPVDEESGDAFRANLVVTVEQLPDGLDTVDAYVDAGLVHQAAELVDFRLIDREPATLPGGEATRTLAHHDVDGYAVTIEQWCVLSGELGYTLTASCWTLDYDSLADAFAASAQTFVP